MFDDRDDAKSVIGKDEGFGLLQELEQNTPEAIRQKRTHFRFPIKTGIILQPGNASQLLDLKAQGVTGDISEGGLGGVFPIPVRVGDIYRLQFDKSQLDLPLIFAQCVSCVLVREGAYRSGFKFFTKISLPENFDVSRHAQLKH